MSIEEEDEDVQNGSKTIFIDEIDDGFITIAKLHEGSAFGELALLEHKPRMATVRCLNTCHFMVLNKDNYTRVIGAKEKRLYHEKINFLKNIPIF
jgi:CRP-like cAMP-binding protein